MDGYMLDKEIDEEKSKDKNILDIYELDREECLQLFEEYSKKKKTIY